MTEYAAEARSVVLREHAAVVEAIDDCADAVAAAWTSSSAESSSSVAKPLRACLDASGVLERLPGVLADAVAATGRELEAQPVAAPPYVVVTSRGPICRATLPDGRLLLRFRVFELAEGNEYVRGQSGAAMVDVEFV